MARRVRTGNLESRNGRIKLQARNAPYWCVLSPGLGLGYRKGLRGGAWLARSHDEETGKRLQIKIGTADDVLDADEIAVLNFWQAQEVTRKWYHETAKLAAGPDNNYDSNYTVADAVRDYLVYYAAEKKGFKVVNAIANAHILPVFGFIRIEKLTTKKILDWFYGIAATPARLRTKKTANQQNFREASSEEDIVRRRRATANRVLTVLKASLNYAWREGKTPYDTEWRKVKPFRNVAAPVVRFLTEAECVRLVNACDKELRLIIQAALFTGCRYGEITRLVASDFNPDSGTILVRISKSGKPRHVFLTEEGIDFFKQVIMNKNKPDSIFLHTDGSVWGKSHSNRPMHEACRKAAISPVITFKILRHTHASILAMKGVSIQVIAKQLGHSDTRITEMHYAHLAPSYVAETIRQNFPRLGIFAPNNITILEPKTSKVAHKVN